MSKSLVKKLSCNSFSFNDFIDTFFKGNDHLNSLRMHEENPYVKINVTVDKTVDSLTILQNIFLSDIKM